MTVLAIITVRFSAFVTNTNHIGTISFGRRNSAAVGPLSSSSIGDSSTDTFALNMIKFYQKHKNRWSFFQQANFVLLRNT